MSISTQPIPGDPVTERLAARTAALKLTPSASAKLDLLRWIAAIFVLLSHARRFFFVPAAEVVDPNLATRLLYFLFRLEGQAVVIFFVLSGLLISTSVTRAWAEGRWSWRWYLTRRLVRLEIVLIPALIFTAVLDNIGRGRYGLEGIYTGHSVVPTVDAFGLTSLSPGVLIGNIFFLQGNLVPTFGSDVPLWSLAYEFSFYLLFPLLFFTVVRSTRMVQRVLYVALAVGVAVAVGRTAVAVYFPIWLLGFLIAALRPLQSIARSSRVGAVATTAGAVAVFAVAEIQPDASSVRHFIADAALGVAVAGLLWVILSKTESDLEPSLRARRFRRTALVLAGFSYSLYLVHMPILVFLRADLDSQGTGLWQPTPEYLLAFVAVVSGICLFSYLFARFTEFNTDRVFGAIWSRIGPRDQAPPPTDRTTSVAENLGHEEHRTAP